MPRCISLKVTCAHVRTCDLNSRYGEVEVQVEVQVCTKYSAYFETSKGNNDILQVQILGTHLRSRELHRVYMDIIQSLRGNVHFVPYVRVETNVRTGDLQMENGKTKEKCKKEIFKDKLAG